MYTNKLSVDKNSIILHNKIKKQGRDSYMTIKEIANLAGVSISTVSKIVNNKAENINSETRDRVLKIVKEYNYAPYSNLKQSNTAKTFIIGVLLNSLGPSFELLNGILTYAQSHGYSTLLFESNENPETELKHITALCKNNVDGVIWEPINELSLENESLFQKQNIPCCFYNCPNHLNSYQPDYEELGYLMTTELILRKHTNVACMIKENNRISEKILNGFKRCLVDNQIFYTNNMVITETANMVQSIVTERYTGIINTHFLSAANFYQSMKRLNYEIPKDFSLITVCDSNFAKESDISVFQIPFRSLGKTICQDIINQCEQQPFSTAGSVLAYNLNHTQTLSSPFQEKNKKIIVVGSINMDTTLNVDELPSSGKAIISNSSSISAGGKGANQAVGIAKLGPEVTLIGKVGTDVDAAIIITTLNEEHVNTVGIKRDSQNITGKAYIHVQADAESTITILTGANHSLSSQDISSVQHLFSGSAYCLLCTESPVLAIYEAARIAKQKGAVNILKPAALNKIPEGLLEQIDIFIPNRLEAQILCPQYDSPEEEAAYFLSLGVKTVIITLGQNGCYLRTQTTSKYFDAVSFPSIDNTGAADAFIAALVSYLSKGYPLETSIQIATYAAGFCISRQGVIPALIDKNSLEQYIAKFEPSLL